MQNIWYLDQWNYKIDTFVKMNTMWSLQTARRNLRKSYILAVKGDHALDLFFHTGFTDEVIVAALAYGGCFLLGTTGITLYEWWGNFYKDKVNINIPVKVKQGYGEHAYNKLILKAKSVSYPLS